MAKRTQQERFWPKVNKSGPIPEHHPELGPCWIWTRTRDAKGYGKFVLGRRPNGQSHWVRAHRIAYEWLVGPLPRNLEPDHLCRVTSCVKAIADEFGPAHLEAVTHRENLLRGNSFAAKNAAKTHCAHGHPFDEQNTAIAHDGTRDCITCRRARNRAYKARRRALTAEGGSSPPPMNRPYLA